MVVTEKPGQVDVSKDPKNRSDSPAKPTGGDGQ